MMPKGSGWDDLSGCPYGELDSATDAFGSFAGICTLGVFSPAFAVDESPGVYAFKMV